MNSDTGELEIKGTQGPVQPDASGMRKLGPMEIVYNNIVKRMKEAQGLEEDADFFRVLHPISDYMSDEDIKILPSNQQARIADARAKRERKKQRRIELSKRGAFYESKVS